MNKVFLGFAVVILILLSARSAAFENAIGVEYGHVGASGDVCDVFPPNSGCDETNQNVRLFYGARFTKDLELRATWTLMDIRFTDNSDPIFNDPDVTSDIADLAGVFHWRANEQVNLQAKLGLAYWYESRAGSLYCFDCDSDSGIAQVMGLQAEFGSRLVRFAISADMYPGVGDANTVTYLSAGIRFVW